MKDDAMDVLFRPWKASPPALAAADAVLLVGVRAHADLVLARPARRVAVQPWRQLADALADRVEEVVSEVPSSGGFAAALVVPDRQRTAGLADLGRALLALRDGGELVVASPVREGGVRYVEDLRTLGVDVDVDVKARCRIARLVAGPGLDRAVAQAWAAGDAAREVPGGLRSRPGLFSWDRADRGSVVLVSVLPPDLAGRVADAGAGWGWLAREILDRCPGVTRLELLEADRRALDLAAQNLAGRSVTAHWCDATSPWPVADLDAVVTNPPFHEGGRADPAIGRAFAAQAWRSLRPGGKLLLVANIHLPYEGILRELYEPVRTLAERDGFKVIEATKPVPAPTRQARS